MVGMRDRRRRGHGDKVSWAGDVTEMARLARSRRRGSSRSSVQAASKRMWGRGEHGQTVESSRPAVSAKPNGKVSEQPKREAQMSREREAGALRHVQEGLRSCRPHDESRPSRLKSASAAALWPVQMRTSGCRAGEGPSREIAESIGAVTLVPRRDSWEARSRSRAPRSSPREQAGRANERPRGSRRDGQSSESARNSSRARPSEAGGVLWIQAAPRSPQLAAERRAEEGKACRDQLVAVTQTFKEVSFYAHGRVCACCDGPLSRAGSGCKVCPGCDRSGLLSRTPALRRCGNTV